MEYREIEISDMYRHNIVLDMIHRYIALHPDDLNLKILDIGWGFGTIFAELNKHYVLDCYACDLRLTRLNKRRMDSMRNIHYKDCNLEHENIPFDKKFDIILCCEVIEHINFSKRLIDDFIQDISRHLTDDGILIMSTPNIASLKNMIKLFLGRNIYDAWDSSFVDSKVNRTPHVHEFTISELEHIFRRNRFRLIEKRACNRPTNKIRSPFMRLKDDLFMVFSKADVTGTVPRI